jgi:hypothetical protein
VVVVVVVVDVVAIILGHLPKLDRDVPPRR